MSLIITDLNSNKVIERTDAFVKIPNQYGIIESFNLFGDRMVTQKNIEIVRKKYGQSVAIDRNWDERNSNVNGAAADFVRGKIPHFPIDDKITVNDLDGRLQFAMQDPSKMVLETIASVRLEKMEILRSTHSHTLEVARYQLLRDGTVFAPSGTLRTSYGKTINWYQEWGVSRIEKAIDASVDPRADLYAVRGAIQDALQNGQTVGGFVAFCSPEFFQAMMINPFITEVVKYTQNAYNPTILTGVADTAGRGIKAPSFEFNGILFIEVRGTYVDETGAAVRYIPQGEARLVGTGISGAFETYYAPAQRFASVNRQAQKSYFFEYGNERDDSIEIMTESNFMNVLNYPQLVAKLTLAPA